MRTKNEIAAEAEAAAVRRDVPALTALVNECLEFTDPIDRAEHLRIESGIYKLNGEPEKSYEKMLEWSDVVIKLGDAAQRRFAYGRVASQALSFGMYPEALQAYDAAIALHDELDDAVGLANVVSDKGIVYFDTGAYNEALECFLRGITLHEKIGNTRGVAIVTTNIGNVHQMFNDTAEAIKYYEQSLALVEQANEPGLAAVTIGNIGDCFVQQKEYAKAMECFVKLREIAVAAKNEEEYHRSLSHICKMNIALGNVDEAERIMEELNSLPPNVPLYMSVMYDAQAKLCEAKADLKGTKEAYIRKLENAVKFQLRTDEADTHKALRDIAQKENDFAAYIKHNEANAALVSEIFSSENSRRIAIQAKDRELRAEREAAEKRKTLLYGALPEHVAERMVRGENVGSDHIDAASVMFLDLVGFTSTTTMLTNQQTIEMLNEVFAVCDVACKGHNVTKIKTIGDSYMGAAL